MRGDTWWDGSALWFAFASLEYQSLDMTWLADWPITIALMTQITVYWELSFCVLIWPRLLLPLVLQHTHGHQSQASEILGLNRATLRHKLRSLGLSVDKTVTEEDAERD